MPVISRFYGIVIRMYFIQADTIRRISMQSTEMMLPKSPFRMAEYLMVIFRRRLLPPLE